jgi:hypothetical protein
VPRVLCFAHWRGEGITLNSDLLQGFYLDDLLIEPLKGQVTDRAGSRHLPPKAVEVLLCLAATPGELVAREELLDKVWGQGLGSQEALVGSGSPTHGISPDIAMKPGAHIHPSPTYHASSSKWLRMTLKV